MYEVSTAGSLASRSLATDSYGIFFLTSLISMAFWAMLCLQTFWYFASYEHDKKSLKWLVVFLWMISTTQTYLIAYGAWDYTIDHFANYEALAFPVHPYIAQFVFAATATISVQGFFVFRICHLSRYALWMVIVVWAPLATFQLVAAYVIVIKSCLSDQSSYAWAALPTDLGIAYLAVSLFVDVAIAICLFELLRRHKEDTTVPSTLKTIQRLMLIAVINMLWTTAFAICDLALFVSYPGRPYYIMCDMPICSLYCNTLLANLNIRTSIAEQPPAMLLNGAEPVTLKLRTNHKSSTQTGSHLSSQTA